MSKWNSLSGSYARVDVAKGSHDCFMKFTLIHFKQTIEWL
jgi:hypothetical protein